MNPLISPEVLARYDRPGPRYTSYPTVPAWHDAFSEEHYRAALDRAAAYPDQPLSLYMHIPFCASRCAYCGCNTVTDASPDLVDQYLDALQAEINLVARCLGARQSVAQLHWGGGTPTYLTQAQIERLHRAITEAFVLREDAEIAVETNPSGLREAQLVGLRQLGFNRISFGVQDLNPAVQQAVGRGQTSDQTRQAVARARALGFRGINLDLIYGLPLQEKQAWKHTLETVAEIRPDRVAIYSFAHLPQRFPHQRAFEGLSVPKACEKYDLFAQARQQLIEAGYVAIGMDHFALPEDELAQALHAGTLSRNFMGYTVKTAPDQVGFGVSSISEIADCYSQNTKMLHTYIQSLSEERFPTERGMALSRDDGIRRWVIRQLLCVFSVDADLFYDRFHEHFDQYFAREMKSLEAYETEGLLEHHGHEWRVTPLGAVFVRNLCMTFDAYLDPTGPVVFSRTV